ncbi:hypothetical protein [Ignavibacterium sp.]|uniref:hypothetical protein n=1 Tax=Ignavibacterium sp. TaxID=2651167 RepID=UPI00307E45A9
MKNSKVVFAVTFSLLVMILILNLTGILDFGLIETLTYLFLTAGFGIWYSSYLNLNKGGIFAGSFIFLSGIVLAVDTFFTIWNPLRMIFPSLFIISGISLFFVFLSDKKRITFLILSILLFAMGMYYLFNRINFKLFVFIEALWDLLLKFWFVLILFAIVLYFIYTGIEQKQNHSSEE